MRKARRIVVFGVLLLAACGPSQDQISAVNSQLAKDISETETASAPVATATETLTPTPDKSELAIRANEYVNEAFANSQEGNDDKAIELYGLAIQTDPNNAQAYLNRGAIYAQQGNVELAISDFDRGLALNPESVTGHTNRSNIYRRNGENEKALAGYELALSLDPSAEELWVIYVNRGGLYLSLEEYSEALVDFDKAVEIRPTDGTSYFLRGAAGVLSGQFDSGLADLRLSLEYGLPPSLVEQAEELINDIENN